MIKKMPILVKLFKMKEFLKIKIEEQLNLYKEKKKAFLKDLKIKWEKLVDTLAKDLFEKFKRCNRLFKGLAETFENDKRKYEIRLRGNYGCTLSRLPSEGNIINVPPTWKCEDQLECIFHEIYEEFLKTHGGIFQKHPSGPAHQRATRMETKFDYKKCCECIK